MKINITNTKAMIIGRKPKKIDLPIKEESGEQVDNFKYLGCNISRNKKRYQKVKQRITIAKKLLTGREVFFAGPWKKNYERD